MKNIHLIDGFIVAYSDGLNSRRSGYGGDDGKGVSQNDQPGNIPGSEDAFKLTAVGGGFGPGSMMIMDHCEQLPFLDLFPQIHFHLKQSVRFTSYLTTLVGHVQVDTGTQIRRSLEDTCMD